jgi:hypothetical protein
MADQIDRSTVIFVRCEAKFPVKKPDILETSEFFWEEVNLFRGVVKCAKFCSSSLSHSTIVCSDNYCSYREFLFIWGFQLSNSAHHHPTLLSIENHFVLSFLTKLSVTHTIVWWCRINIQPAKSFAFENIAPAIKDKRIMTGYFCDHWHSNLQNKENLFIMRGKRYP